MTPATRIFIEALIRRVKGIIADTEKWLEAESKHTVGYDVPVRTASLTPSAGVPEASLPTERGNG